MKLATLKNHTRDGKLVVVSKDLSQAIRVPEIASTLQVALEHWHDCEARLNLVYQSLNQGVLKDAFTFDQTQAESPLPRAYQWADGSAYVNHVELVRKARGAKMPESFWTDPLMYQGGSDFFLAPRAPIEVLDLDWGVDFEAEIAVVTDDVPIGVNVDDSEQHIRLLMLVNDVSLRNLIPDELAKSFGFFHSKPPSAFSPVAVTPDELGENWAAGKVKLPLVTHLNDELFGEPYADVDMTFNFFQLIAHAAKTRPLSCGSIIGSGTVSNIDRSRGSSCLAEKRMLELIEHGKAITPFMQYSDRVSIEMFDEQQQSIFGRIEQEVLPTQQAS